MKWEVRTMRSGTSFFDWTVFKKTICRFWPLWGAYFAIWLVALPLNGLMTLRLDRANLNGWGGNYMKEFAFSQVPGMAGETCLVLAVIFGALCAMAVFSHLYNARSANLFGSLPIRREGLFLTHYLAGLTFLIVPNLVIFLLTALVELAGGMVCWQGLGFWLAVTCGEGFFFYSLAVFCAMFTGHILALPAFYAVANVLVIGVTELVDTVFRAFYYGFCGFTEGVYNVVKWLTPVVQLEDRVEGYSYGVDLQYLNPEELAGRQGVLVGDRFLELHGLGVVGIYAIVAVVLAVCAFFLYRARRLESAGDVVAVNPMKPVFKYGVALCAGLALGMLTTMFTGGGEAMLMAAIVVWGVIGYFAAEMLLQKSFRVFKKWKGAAVVAAVFVALFLAVGFDFTGFETRVPSPDSVDSVRVEGINAVWLGDDGENLGYRGQEITDPDLIELITILHREAVEQRGEERQTQYQIRGVSTTLNVTYRLKGGGTLTRRYNGIWLDPKEMHQEGTAAWAVQRLYDNRELYWQVYGFDHLEELLSAGGRLESAARESYNEVTGVYEEAVFYGRDASALLSAVKEDFFAGRIGVFRVDDEEHWHGGSPDNNLSFSATGPEDAEGHRPSAHVTIAIQDTASSTLAALEGMADRIEGDQPGAWTDGFPATEAG